jgi:cytochrome c
MRVSLYLVSVLASSTLWAEENALELAKNSGCLACHTVERKVIGPAWKDVAARYKDDSSMKEVLVNKIKTGGKGNWLEVTNGAMMPPYSPRVNDEDIAKLVDFILSL